LSVEGGRGEMGCALVDWLLLVEWLLRVHCAVLAVVRRRGGEGSGEVSVVVSKKVEEEEADVTPGRHISVEQRVTPSVALVRATALLLGYIIRGVDSGMIASSLVFAAFGIPCCHDPSLKLRHVGE
jgi:hypothetical protein